MKRITNLSLTILAIMLFSSCQLFLSERGGQDQACFEDKSCDDGMTCNAENICVSPFGDGDTDGDQGPGDGDVADGDTPSDGDFSPPQPDENDLWISSTPPDFVRSFDTFTYQVVTNHPATEVEFTFLNAPTGMSINSSGLIRWNPGDLRERRFEIVLLASRNNEVSVHPIPLRVSRASTALTIPATELAGDSIILSAPGESLNGFSMTLPDEPGESPLIISAVDNAFTAPRNLERIGPTLLLEPHGQRFSDPVSLGIPFDISSPSSAGEIFFRLFDVDLNQTELLTADNIDIQNGLAFVSIDHFSWLEIYSDKSEELQVDILPGIMASKGPCSGKPAAAIRLPAVWNTLKEGGYLPTDPKSPELVINLALSLFSSSPVATFSESVNGQIVIVLNDDGKSYSADFKVALASRSRTGQISSSLSLDGSKHWSAGDLNDLMTISDWLLILDDLPDDDRFSLQLNVSAIKPTRDARATSDSTINRWLRWQFTERNLQTEFLGSFPNANCDWEIDDPDNPGVSSAGISRANDRDRDGYAEGEDCNDDDRRINPGAVERCGNGINEDCKKGDESCGSAKDMDVDLDGWSRNAGDCNDNSAEIYPGAIEICGDGFDGNCEEGDLNCPTTSGAPIIDLMEIWEDRTEADVNESLEIRVEAHDPDDDQLNYLWVHDDAIGIFGDNDEHPWRVSTISATPGLYSITVFVSDSETAVAQTISLLIRDPADPCAQQCYGRECGPDGCGGNCGACPDTTDCSADGRCLAICSFDCGDRECGSACPGANCGECDAGLTCKLDGLCAAPCEDPCSETACGASTCGSVTCWTCKPGDVCADGSCVNPCADDCVDMACGFGPICALSCGECDESQTCNIEGVCAPGAEPTCGNETLERGEYCDSDTLDCSVIFADPDISGQAACSDNCVQYDTSDCKSPAVCNNGLIEGSEICDSDSLDCRLLNPGYTGGRAPCKTNCKGYNETDCLGEIVAECEGACTAGENSAFCLDGLLLCECIAGEEAGQWTAQNCETTCTEDAGAEGTCHQGICLCSEIDGDLDTDEDGDADEEPPEGPCFPDPCNAHGACNPDDGTCTCNEGYDGPACDECSTDYVGYPDCAPNPCIPDPCNGYGECNTDDGSCTCEENYTGDNCEQCATGYFGYPLCVEELVWVSIPAGNYWMGCSLNDVDCYSDEKPRHYKTIAAFEITETEITQEQYEALAGSNPSFYGDCPTCPVERVNWETAKSFCEALGGHLPSEAQWEYAARAGTTTPYVCGETTDCLSTIAWYNDTSESARTHPVAWLQSNSFGLYDMLGNVDEWVSDCWHNSYSDAPSDETSWDEDNCTQGVIRGGNYGSDAFSTRVSRRKTAKYNNLWYTRCFRCAKDASQE